MTIAVIMGVSGSGKSTVAAAIAKAEGWLVVEGDMLHPASNIAKMKAGTPLTDEDRWPWLHAIAGRMNELQTEGVSATVACSALKRCYRALLIDGRPDTVLIYLRGSRALIGQRLESRKCHFMPPLLLDSQFATLEEPGPDEHPIVVDLDAFGETVSNAVLQRLRERRHTRIGLKARGTVDTSSDGIECLDVAS